MMNWGGRVCWEKFSLVLSSYVDFIVVERKVGSLMGIVGIWGRGYRVGIRGVSIRVGGV